MYAHLITSIFTTGLMVGNGFACNTKKPGKPVDFNPVPSDRSDNCKMFDFEHRNPRGQCQPAIDKFNESAVYDAMTVFYGHVWPDNNDNPESNATLTCMATFNCTDYGQGIEGIAIKYMFAELYAQDDFKLCGNLTFDGGCSISVDACSGADNCTEIIPPTKAEDPRCITPYCVEPGKPLPLQYGE